MSKPIVIKVGGSTLGESDTSLEDVAILQRRGMLPVVVHGGGPIISDWMARQGLQAHFEGGRRVTDADSLRVVVAVLAGLVNKELVATLHRLGGRAVGLSGVDGGLLRARPMDESLGYVGEIGKVDIRVLGSIMADGFVPVVAPTALWWEGDSPTGKLLNVNADIAAGAIAAAFPASRLVFLTDVPGVQDGDGKVIATLSHSEASSLTREGVISGGMIPKIEACVSAGRRGCDSIVVDGRKQHALLTAVESGNVGTLVGGGVR